MREQSDEALLLGHAVLDNLVADQEGLDAGLRDVRHNVYSTGVFPAVKGIYLSCGFLRNDGRKRACLADHRDAPAAFYDITKPRQPGSDTAIMRADRDELTLMRVEVPTGQPDLSSLEQVHFNGRAAGRSI